MEQPDCDHVVQVVNLKADVNRHTSTVVIQPNRRWLYIPWREIYEYRDLIRLLVRRNFVVGYKQTVMGPLWYIINPLTSTLVFTVIFGHLAKLPTDGLPKPLFYLGGMLGWTYFMRCVGGTSGTLTGNAALFGKVYFPRLVVPISRVLSALFGFAIQFVTFLALWTYFKFFTGAGPSITMRPHVLLIPLLLLHSAAAGMGVGLWFSALTAKYRDFQNVLNYLLRFWMYGTPIVYPLSMIPHKWRWLSGLNPMTPAVELWRYAFLGVGTVKLHNVATSIVIVILLLFSGMMMFSRTERTFIDTV